MDGEVFMWKYRYSDKAKRSLAFVMAFVLGILVFLPEISVIPTRASEVIGQRTVLTSALGDTPLGHKLYCIDRKGYAIWGIAEKGDVYEMHRPSNLSVPLTDMEKKYAFWGMLSLKASLGDETANRVIRNINMAAAAWGKIGISNLVSVIDLRKIIHAPEERAKYPWLETVSSNCEEYLQMGGLLSAGDKHSTSMGVGGGKIPDAIALCNSPENANQIDSESMTLSFASDGSDSDFIRSVPLEFSNDGGLTFSMAPTDGWTYEKTDSQIIFSNPNPDPPKTLLRFKVEGTSYASSGGGYSSVDDLIDNTLQVWECVECSGTHTGGTPASSYPCIHQRLVWMEIAMVPVNYYASLSGTSGTTPEKGQITFEVFRHEEDFISTYNLQMYKYDHETGKALEGSQFALFERFDDKDEVDTERDGAVRLYEGGEPYAGHYIDDPVVWDGFRQVGSALTDKNGHVVKNIEHGYHYDKTFCDGHPAPTFVAVPEEEEDDDGNVTNGEEIKAAQSENIRLANSWLSCERECDNQAGGDFEGVHFHWILDDVEASEIRRIASGGGEEGETPYAGSTEGADAETSYVESGCKEDCEQTYEKFISMKYSYTFKEFKARDGYILHDVHSDDLPIEIITTDASEHGANAFFGDGYSRDVTVQNEGTRLSAKNTTAHSEKSNIEEKTKLIQNLFSVSDEKEVIPKSLKRSVIPQNVVFFTALDAAVMEEDVMEGATMEEATESELKASISNLDVRRVKKGFVFVDENDADDAADDVDDDDSDVEPESNCAKDLFRPAYESALVSAGVGSATEVGDPDNFSHCNDIDNEGNAWRIYDHRTEGEIHINKKDLDLKNNENEFYDSFGDAQADATLEGAVYGLFAAEDLTHPDGKTGVVYRANNLVAVATTDKNGNASFLACTEAPGRRYDYSKGSIIDTDDGWRKMAPENLYIHDESIDDYTEDGEGERIYYNNLSNNGNSWIGRPLLMGEYYVKELSRSEGYELSIGNKLHAVTNLGQDTEAGAPDQGEGYAHVSLQMYGEEQTGEGDADTNEIFFKTESKDTKDGVYDIVVSGLPDGVKFYRMDEGKGTISSEAGTGEYEKIYTGKMIVAENDYQYPKYNADGTFMTKEILADCETGWMRQVNNRELDKEIIEDVLLDAQSGMTEEENAEKLLKVFEEKDFNYIKGKIEKILRRHGKATPRIVVDGKNAYSDIKDGIFDRGVRDGEESVYGAPVLTIAVPVRKNENQITVGDAIMSVLDFYDTHPYLSYGGLDEIHKSLDVFEITVYAGVSGMPENFMVVGSDPENDSTIYHRVKWMPDDEDKSPRYVYVAYSNNKARNPFGTYTNYRETTAGNQVMALALLKTDAVVEGDGTIAAKKNKVNVYYKAGEIPYDADGEPIREFTYREITENLQHEVMKTKWILQDAVRKEDGSYVIRVNANFTDSFGNLKTNQGILQELEFKAVLKEKKVVISEEEAKTLGDGFSLGHEMNSSGYYTMVKNARAKAYPNYENTNLIGADSYVVSAVLAYPGQKEVYQDAGTREKPLSVFERVIRQKIKIVKDIEVSPDGTYAHNTYAESGHEDSFTKKYGGEDNAASKVPDFRFKLYLKSNLERLYRNDDGEIEWLDSDGKILPYAEIKRDFVELNESFASVQKIFTQVSHDKDSRTAGSINNNVWENAIEANTSLYGFDEDGKIADTGDKNSGYTRLLETVLQTKEDGAGNVRKTSGYQYDKFFDAIAVANRDKWQQADAKYTSFKPFSWIVENVFGSDGGEKSDPVWHNNEKIKNTIRTSDAAIQNAKRSDAVRQFAIDWYLNDEVKKKTKLSGNIIKPQGGYEEYQDDIYDEALYEAILKSEEYLKPFFAYDLDKLYAIEWDSEKNGGLDQDTTTLSVNSLSDCYYAVSKYLPYGTYVAVEQQPYSGALEDFKNQHYRIDKPKEIEVPSVYETDGNNKSPEKKSAFYKYDASLLPENIAAKYKIRMNEEWGDTNQADLREYVIRAHSNDGNYEIYKYGLDADKLNGIISYSGGEYDYSGFSISQREKAPYKDIYQNENEDSCYKSNEKVEKYYHYGAISEQSGFADDVEYPYGSNTDDNNPAGFYFKDNVRTITGAITGFDGRYFQGLVPYSVTEPAGVSDYDEKRFTGYADGKYRNTFYTAKIRIEKLDTDTGENILHDDAVFAIYAASRDTSKYSEGNVLFYEKDTQVTASLEFLMAMGAEKITPVDMQASVPSTYPWKAPYTGKYTGVIPKGTPICNEDEQIVMRDEFGNRTGTFKVYSTLRDFGGNGEEEPSNQNTGYLVTPQPLGAGVYVLCELSAPEGYVKTKPVAVEVYSDEVTYYRNGQKDKRVAAAVYKESVTRTNDNGENIRNNDGTEPNGNKPQDQGDVARLYVENTPIRLEISKVKQDEDEILFELNERYEGSITELSGRYGLENLELAYNASGAFLGYGWPKGYLERLKERQDAGELIDLIYEDNVFTGRAVLHHVPDTAKAVNRYLPGAEMRLYDAIEVRKNGDSEDRAYAGVNVVRDSFGNVRRMYVQKGYAGNKLLYVKNKDTNEKESDYKKYTQDDVFDDQGEGVWTLKRIERDDTDILYFDLGDLDIFTTIRGVRYAYNEKGETIRPKDGEPIYAMKNGIPFLKIISPGYEELKYSSKERRFEKVPSGTEIFHVASDGSLDGEVEPYTGMAYVTEEKTGKILVWPVHVSKDQYGNVIARDKIKTGRTATINADTQTEYTIGTYEGAMLKPQVNPALNESGLPLFYQKSKQTYIKGYPVYDRDGDYVRYRYSDLLKAYNANAWELKLKSALYDIGQNPEKRDDDLPVYHRQGEAYLMENSWITGDMTPNDPFNTNIGDGQVDVLKRVWTGTYILEETRAPSGYAKRLPVGLTVEESCEVQNIRLTNRPITVQIEKIDAPDGYLKSVIDYDNIMKETDQKSYEFGKGSYSFSSVEGAVLALYPAKRVESDDLKKYPSGFYLEKKSSSPASWTILDETNQKKTVTGKWTVGKTPVVWEGIPAGDYILEETENLPGYLPGRMEVIIREESELQVFTMREDHIKTAFFKYENKDGVKSCLPNKYAAELTLYEALTDENGIITDENGIPVYDRDRKVTSWKTEDAKAYTEGEDSFLECYKKLYEEYKTGFNSLTWYGYNARKQEEETTEKGESVRQLWDLGNGSQVLIQVTRNLKKEGKAGYDYEFLWNYRVEGSLISYDTSDGIHRIDYLTVNETDINSGTKKKGYYVLVETKTPEGYQKAEPKPVIVDETAEIQLYGLENRAKSVWISKLGQISEDSEESYYLKGAKMAVFKAAQDGSLLREDKYLIDCWTSGDEGYFTEEDADNKKIPDGFKAGDQRPHKISPIAYGTYYLVEISPPDGYRTMEPKKFIVAAASAEKIEAVNKLKQGKIRIEKSDERKPDEKLAGAVFEIKNRETGEYFLVETDESGQAESKLLQTGNRDSDGTWIPYHYEIREKMPPDGYQIKPIVYETVFEEQKECEVLTYELAVTNETTKIKISKLDFDSGLFLTGAKLAVYAAKLKDGIYTEAGDALESWDSDGKPHVIDGKLIAGHTYLLKELEAPAGYNVERPVVFTVSNTGRSINIVNDGVNMLEIETAGDLLDNVAAVRVNGRKALRTIRTLKDLDDGKEYELSSLTESSPEKLEDLSSDSLESMIYLEQKKCKEEGLLEGQRLEFKENIIYSDGNIKTIHKDTFRLDFDENGYYPLEVSVLKETVYRIEKEDGKEIESWNSENAVGFGYLHEIRNPEYKDPQEIKVISDNGKNGAAVLPGSVILYETTYRNQSDKTKDLKVELMIPAGCELMTAASTAGVVKEESYYWNVENVAPGSGGTIIASVLACENLEKDNQENAPKIIVKAKIDGKNYETINPILSQGALAIVGNITGTAEKSIRQSQVTYTVYLRDKTGDELKGLISYTGSKSGNMRSGEKVSLFCGEFLVFTGIPWGTSYEIKADIPESTEDENKLEWKSSQTTGYTSKFGITALWEFHQNDLSVRDVLKRGESYRLIETVEFDGKKSEKIETNRMTFSLGDDAQIDGIGMVDVPTRLVFTKTDLGGKELPGAQIDIVDHEGNIVESWISTDIPHEIIGKLTPGESYIMRETSAPDGYAYAEEILFTVSKDGTVDKVLMKDAPTHVEITKYSLSGEKELPGAKMELWEDKEGGILVDTWISDRSAHVMKGKLIAGNTYVLIEKTAPDGYWKSEKVTFKVSSDGSIDYVKMYDKPTEVHIEKREWSEGEEGKFIKGAHLKITDENGNSVTEWTSEEKENVIQGVLKEGGRYILKEVQAPFGYEIADPIDFTVSDDETITVVKMYDRIKMGKKSKPGHDKDKPEKKKKVTEEHREGYLTVHVREKLRGEGKIELGERKVSPLPKMGYGQEAYWGDSDANEDKAQERYLNDAILFLWKWKLLIGFLCIGFGAGIEVKQRRRKKSN